VKLVAGDVERTAPLTVRKDPNTTGTEDDVVAQTAMMVQIRGNMNTAAKRINDAESVRSQIAVWKVVVGEGEPMKALRAAADALDSRIVAVEAGLFNITATGRGQDQLRTSSQMVEKVSHLSDVVSYADFAPTDSQLQVGASLTREVAHDRELMDGILSRTVATFNATLRERQDGSIVVPTGK